MYMCHILSLVVSKVRGTARVNLFNENGSFVGNELLKKKSCLKSWSRNCDSVEGMVGGYVFRLLQWTKIRYEYCVEVSCSDTPVVCLWPFFVKNQFQSYKDSAGSEVWLRDDHFSRTVSMFKVYLHTVGPNQWAPPQKIKSVTELHTQVDSLMTL